MEQKIIPTILLREFGVSFSATEKIRDYSEYERMLFECTPDSRDGVSSSGQVVFGGGYPVEI